MKIKKFVYLSFLIVFALFFTLQGAQAADFRVAVKNKGNIHVEENENIKNLYTAGNIVSIDADVQKGVHAAGNVVTINGNVGGHSLLGGRNFNNKW